MLRILRSIRRSLTATGSTRKYILYAIGEIALVVIGILIALQVNNRNEVRKYKDVQKIFLENLGNEFRINSEQLDERIADHLFVFNKNQQLATLMHPRAQLISSELLDTLMWSLAFVPEYKPVTVYSENLEVVEDDTLKVLVANWSTKLSSYRVGAQIIYDLYYNFIYPSISNLYQMKNLPTIGLLHDSPRSGFRQDQIDLLSNASLENHVIMRSYNAAVIYDRAKSLERLQNEIIQRIDYLLDNDFE